MTDINIILSNLKVFHYSPWEEDKLEECKKLLADMSKEELRTIMHSKWMDKGNALYPTLFELFFKDELKNVVIKLNEMKTLDLIQELKETKSSYKKEKIPEILLNRYESMDDVERKDVFKILLRKGLVDKDNNKQVEILKDISAVTQLVIINQIKMLCIWIMTNPKELQIVTLLVSLEKLMDTWYMKKTIYHKKIF